MTLVHAGFHIFQVMLGSYSLYALLSNTFQIAVIVLFITIAIDMFDYKIKEFDEKVKLKTGL